MKNIIIWQVWQQNPVYIWYSVHIYIAENHIWQAQAPKKIHIYIHPDPILFKWCSTVPADIRQVYVQNL